VEKCVKNLRFLILIDFTAAGSFAKPNVLIYLANNPEFDRVKKEMNQVLHDWLEETGWKGNPALKY
jgi:nitrate/TMAO reductase-like tetraheme cytochrome c subunit